VYSATASHEVKLVRVKKGKAAVFYARFQNDGTDPDVFKIHGGGTTRKFAVRYFSGTTDITRKVVAGTYRTNSVGPAGSRTIKVVVRPRSAAAVGDVRGVLIRATSVDDNVKKDAVIAKTKVVS